MLALAQKTHKLLAMSSKIHPGESEEREKMFELSSSSSASYLLSRERGGQFSTAHTPRLPEKIWMSDRESTNKEESGRGGLGRCQERCTFYTQDIFPFFRSDSLTFTPPRGNGILSKKTFFLRFVWKVCLLYFIKKYCVLWTLVDFYSDRFKPQANPEKVQKARSIFLYERPFPTHAWIHKKIAT